MKEVWESRSNRAGLQAMAASIALRAALLLVIFSFFKTPWATYLTTSDASSFIPVARSIAGLEPADQLKFFDTRVFPGWPLLIAPFLAMHLPDQIVLGLALIFAGLAPFLYARLTNDLAGTWLLVAFPPAWLLAGLHPISESLYFVLIVSGCLAVRRGEWFLAGLAAGTLVTIKPFGVAWILAFALPLFTEPRPGRKLLLYGSSILLPLAFFFCTNLMLYGDLWHQFRVYARPLAELNLPAEINRENAPAGHWGWPFVHLVSTPFRYEVPSWKIVYIATVTICTFALAWQAVRQLAQKPRLPSWQCAALAGFLINTALSFCTGPYWGFHSVDRYLSWGLPGALIALQVWRQRYAWLPWPLGIGSIVASFFSIWIRFR